MKVIYPDISKNIGYNPHNHKTPFYLLKGFEFKVYWNEKSCRTFRIPTRFMSDGCTIKAKLFQIVLGCSHEPTFLIASIIHDYFTYNKRLIDRKSASEILYQVLIAEKTPKWKAKLMYYGVELYQKYINKWK